MLDEIKKFLNENQDPKTVEKIMERLKGILMTGEEVDYIAVQKNLPLIYPRIAWRLHRSE